MTSLYKTIILSFIALVIVACGEEKQAESKVKEAPAIDVKISKPLSVGELENNRFSVSGKLSSATTSNLSAKIMGRITRVYAKVGQQVRAGQVLMTIKTDDISAQKNQASAAIEEAKVALNHAENNYNRFKTLYKQQSATKMELENVQMQYEMMKNKVEQAQQAQRQVEHILSEASVTAPFSGTVVAKFAEVGGIAAPGMPLITIESTGELVLKAMVPESEIGQVKEGKSVEIIFKSYNQSLNGKVTLVNASSSMSGSQYEVEIKPNFSASQRSLLKSGMFANVIFTRSGNIKSTQLETSIKIPKSALVEMGQLKGVFTITKDNNRVVLRWLRLGKYFGNEIEVLSGLSSDESYVIESKSKLTNGAKVNIIQ